MPLCEVKRICFSSFGLRRKLKPLFVAVWPEVWNLKHGNKTALTEGKILHVLLTMHIRIIKWFEIISGFTKFLR